MKSTNLEKLDYGLNWVPSAGAQVGLKHESAKERVHKDNVFEFGRFFLLFSHAVSSTQAVGTEFTLDW